MRSNSRIPFSFLLSFIFLIAAFGLFLYRQNYKMKDFQYSIESLKREILQVSQAEKSTPVIFEKEKANWGLVQKNATDAVVQVFSEIAAFNWLEPYKSPEQFKSTGTGFFIDEEGRIITNAHVIDQARTLSIQIPSFGKKRFDVDIIGVAVDRDLSLLKLKDEDLKEVKESLKKIPYLKFGDSDQVMRSNEIMAFGYPLGQQMLKSTTGIVSGREHIVGQHMIQTTAPINPGNSGGPSINLAGEVVGVNTANVPAAQNVGYFIPVNEVKLFLHHLKNYKQPEDSDLKDANIKFLRKPYLGILFNAASIAMTKFLKNPLPGGLYVAGVQKGSPLKKAGVKIGDMIYEIDGYPLDIYGELNVPWSEDKISIIDYVARLKLDDKVNLLTYREGTKKLLTLTFKESELAPIRLMYPRYEKIDYEILGGLVVMPLALNHLPLLGADSPDLVKYLDVKSQLEGTLIITHVMLASAADKARTIKKGIIIKEINGIPVKTLPEFRDAVKKSVNTKFLTIKTNQDIFIVLPFDKILLDEHDLSKTYHYEITPFVKNLILKNTLQAPVPKEEKSTEKIPQKEQLKTETPKHKSKK